MPSRKLHPLRDLPSMLIRINKSKATTTMTYTLFSRNNLIGFGLVSLMALTRFHHFGSLMLPPDASLAVFFLAGLLLRSPWLLLALLVEAGLIDYLAVTRTGVSDWCITPAYLFLIPTYGVMWLAGRYCAKRQFLGLTRLPLLAIVAVAATTLAFVISNGSFYLLSGRYAELTLVDYSTRVAAYYLPYLGGCALYLTAILGMQGLLGQYSHKPTGLLPTE